MSDIQQTLKEMAQLTALTGRISDIQERNMKMFPLVFFNDVEESKVDYNLSPIQAEETKLISIKPHISYHLVLDESKNLNLEERLLALEKSIATLFWGGIMVEVFFNGKLKYRNGKLNGL